MKSTGEKKGKWFLLKTLGVLGALLLAGGLYFIYGVLPQKVAIGIAAKARIRQPLTQTPKEDGFAYSDVAFPTADGVTLSGWWMPAAFKGKVLGTILLSHGAFHNREQVLGRAEFLVKEGYQVLLFDLRGCGLSGDSPLSGGVLEAGDFPAAEAYLEKTHRLQKPVLFFGFSLGAMGALRAAVQAPGADAVIADSPLANLASYVSRRTAGGVFAALPGFLGRCLAAYDRVTGLSLKESDLDLVPVVEKLRDPVLYITGENDDLSKSDEVRLLFQHTASPHRRLAYMPEAGHEETFSKFPMIYERIVDEFLTDMRNGFPKPVEWKGGSRDKAEGKGAAGETLKPSGSPRP